MPTPFESAQLNLTLFDMRREPELRKARHWFITEFFPDTPEEFFAAMISEKNAWIRMVIGYWDMAASMVTHNAIDAEMFLAAHGEIFGAFCKVQPFLTELRGKIGPRTLMHVEQVVMAVPGADEMMAQRRQRLKGLWEARQAAAAASLATVAVVVR